MEIIGGIATIPQREHTLKQVIDSIYRQVSILYVALNGYKSVPQWLRDIPNVKFVISNGQRGDAMKFAMVEKEKCYYFAFDDDLVYNSDYVNYLRAGVDKYKGLVSLHGRIYGRPVDKFYKWRANYHCLHRVDEDVSVDVVGSGCCAFHTSQLKVRLEDFEQPNMADLYISRLAWNQEIPLKVLKHYSDYLTYLPQPKSETIWHKEAKTKFEKQTILLKSFLK